MSLPSSFSKNEHVVELKKGKRQRTEKVFGQEFIASFLIENSDKLNE